jgi:hypothetical protein
MHQPACGLTPLMLCFTSRMETNSIQQSSIDHVYFSGSHISSLPNFIALTVKWEFWRKTVHCALVALSIFMTTFTSCHGLITVMKGASHTLLVGTRSSSVPSPISSSSISCYSFSQRGSATKCHDSAACQKPAQDGAKGCTLSESFN